MLIGDCVACYVVIQLRTLIWSESEKGMEFLFFATSMNILNL